MIPNGLVGAEFNVAELMVVPDDGQSCPLRVGVSAELPWCGQPRAFLARTPFAAVGRSGFIQSRVQAQASNDGHWLAKRLASVQEIQSGIGAVADDDERSSGQ